MSEPTDRGGGRLAAAARFILAVVLCATVPSTSAWATPVQQVEGIAAQQPAPTTPQQAAINRAAVQPSVDAAVARGEGPALLQSPSPDVKADLLHYVTTSQTGQAGGYHPLTPPRALAARRHVRAHAAGCWGWIADQVTFSVAGGTIGWIYVRNNGWCGNGYAITWYGGPTYAAWSWGPYCWTSKGSDYSWDGWPTWIHTAHWGEFGVSYPWGCAGIRGGKAVVRFAANGYWDRYND
jgi:hypothetical protein